MPFIVFLVLYFSGVQKGQRREREKGVQERVRKCNVGQRERKKRERKKNEKGNKVSSKYRSKH